MYMFTDIFAERSTD